MIKVTDEEDGKPYYAQIRGFVQDQYCEKSAALTWLIPTQASPNDLFDRSVNKEMNVTPVLSNEPMAARSAPAPVSPTAH